MTGRGGKGANQAVAAARLGADVHFVGRVGDDDFGRAGRASLVDEGVDASALTTTPDASSGVAMIVVDQRAENLIALAHGANARVCAADVDAAWPRLRECGLVLLQLEVPLEATLRAAALARAQGLPVILNPAPAPSEPLPPELLAAVDVIVPNEHEARTLTGVPVTDVASAHEAALRLRASGPRAAIVTLGERGALLLADHDPVHIPAARVTAIDTTAAGDAFCGALAFALARGDELIAAARLATRAAGLAVTRRGAQASLPTYAELEVGQ